MLLKPLAALTLHNARVRGAEAARAQVGLEQALTGIADPAYASTSV